VIGKSRLITDLLVIDGLIDDFSQLLALPLTSTLQTTQPAKYYHYHCQ
jgi:hypothetical protein